MTRHTKLIPVGVLAATLITGSSAAAAAQRAGDDRIRNEPAQSNQPSVSGAQRDHRHEKQNNERGTPRFHSVRPTPRHYYGSGGHFSVYFGLGTGYRYGVPYSGRVYGYIPPVYRARPVYGDVRLDVRPRDAAVYVDGYYAGVVDNFDGVFQHLTLSVGQHEIEIAAPGLEPRFFDISVDPARTISLRADLLG
jgi:hypothetical protein